MTPLPLPSFSDEFGDYAASTSIWEKSHGWTNGSPFNVGWLADHVLPHPSGTTNDPAAALLASPDTAVVMLRLDNVRSSGKPYSSGEYRTRLKASYGTVSARIRPPKGSGVVSSLFTYTGPSEGDPWDEIDIEFLGKDTTKLHTNYFVNGVGGHAVDIDLGFDASLAYHEYKFTWAPASITSPASITWYVDGNVVREVKETAETGPLPTNPGRVTVNLWAGDNTVTSWLGRFRYTRPVQAFYDSVSYTALPTTTASASP